MNRISLAPRPNQHAPNTAKIVTDRESKVTNEVGIVTTPDAPVEGLWNNATSRLRMAIFEDGEETSAQSQGSFAIAVRNQRGFQ